MRKKYGNWNQEKESPQIIAYMLVESDGNNLDIDRHDRQLARQVSNSESENKNEYGQMRAMTRGSKIRSLKNQDEPKFEHTSKIQDSNENCKPTQVSYFDSDYTKDPNSRRSVFGYIFYENGIHIYWRSKKQKPNLTETGEIQRPHEVLRHDKCNSYSCRQ